MNEYQRRKIVQIAKFNNKTAQGLSILPTNGVKNRVKIVGGNSPITFKNTKRKAMNVPPTIKSYWNLVQKD